MARLLGSAINSSTTTNKNKKTKDRFKLTFESRLYADNERDKKDFFNKSYTIYDKDDKTLGTFRLTICMFEEMVDFKDFKLFDIKTSR